MKIGDKVRRKGGGTIESDVTVVGMHASKLWVVGAIGNPWTTTTDLWEVAPPPEPEVGDVWTWGMADYRVLGVDKKRGVWHICPVDDFHAPADYPTKQDWVQMSPAKDPHVITRQLPDDVRYSNAKLKERP